jgi:transcriptional regulator with XRE-family HTH domain
VAAFGGIAQRAWFAWQCLPRQDDGCPAALRELERANGLSNMQLNKLVRGISKRPGLAELRKMANALETTVEWLQFEEGAGPTAKHPVPPWPGPPTPKPKSGLSSGDEAALKREAKQLPKSVSSSRRRNGSK